MLFFKANGARDSRLLCDMPLMIKGIFYFGLGLGRTVLVMVDVRGVEARGKLDLLPLASRNLSDCGLGSKLIALSLVKIRRVR